MSLCRYFNASLNVLDLLNKTLKKTGLVAHQSFSLSLIV